MSGEDQERFEDYLELEQYLEELQAGHIAHPPAEMTPAQARVYRMAALFRSASPEASEPRPEFAASLQARLEQELQQPAEAPQPLPKTQEQSRPRSLVSRRRALFAGGAAVAASLAIGVGIDHAIEQSANNGTNATASTNTPLIAPGVPTIWHPVTTVAQLGKGAVPFNAGAVVGYIIYDDGDDGDPDKGKIIAMSAACTHMGCIVNWQDSDRKFHCPCHGGAFTEYGNVDNGTGSWGVRYLRPLPRLNTKVENGHIYVEVPAPAATNIPVQWHNSSKK
jgi:Rieske Fe-S protein